VVINGLLITTLWVAFAGYEDPMSWIIGFPTVIAATWSRNNLSPRRNGGISIAGILRLLPVFLWESFKGGFDVARRVLRLRLEINPGLFDYRLNLSSTSARVLFVDLVSLLPGTLSADIRGDLMRIHALDLDQDSVTELGRLERRVAAVFGQSLPDKAV
jgi:multicomponent Na+:H+ antiporter subunit E